jgi:hypothetical protein
MKHVLLLAASAMAQTLKDIKRSDLIFPFGFATDTFEWPLLLITPSYQLQGSLEGYKSYLQLTSEEQSKYALDLDSSIAKYSYQTLLMVDSKLNRAL